MAKQRSCRILALAIPLACAAQKTPPAPLDSNWSSCGFPLEAPNEITEGWVSLKLTIDADGAPVWVERIAASDPVFEKHAERCALRGQFDPALDQNGNPVSQEIRIKIVFRR